MTDVQYLYILNWYNLKFNWCRSDPKGPVDSTKVWALIEEYRFQDTTVTAKTVTCRTDDMKVTVNDNF